MTLKTRNSPYIVGSTILLYVGFAVFNGFNWSFAETMKLGKDGVTLNSPVLSLAFYVFALVMTHILPSEWKHRFIYMRWHHALPGCRVFTDLIDRDSRISRETLISQNGALPTKPDEQNYLWYKIYKVKQSDEVVNNSHGRWLLFQNVFTVAIVLALPSTVCTFWRSGAKAGSLYTALYLLLLAALWVCARNTGERFTCNVLAR